MISCDYQTGTETIRVWYPQHSLIDITIHGEDIVEYSYHVLLKGNKKLIEDKLPDFIFYLMEEYGLNDQYQKLTKLFPEIQQIALAWSVAFASVEEIEERNILGATMLAMNRAIAGLSLTPDLALIDGNRNKEIEVPSRCVVHGDARCASIAAASILAKVSRDHLMLELAREYPQYGFEKHKGYGTRAHYAALREYGPCPAHRPSFL